ncbi:hypothetical protein EVAR_34200_1 [Eumeta japonica]|uniref:Uncharacterized protein n=1 Tax=Eumeta variegata TaxID=151549 RepID=A0A4C1WJN2_EUMVA|nr:hypothetical protein EVAR_34200_1 [Eumeta japonica]
MATHLNWTIVSRQKGIFRFLLKRTKHKIAQLAISERDNSDESERKVHIRNVLKAGFGCDNNHGGSGAPAHAHTARCAASFVYRNWKSTRSVFAAGGIDAVAGRLLYIMRGSCGARRHVGGRRGRVRANSLIAKVADRRPPRPAPPSVACAAQPHSPNNF